MSDEKTRCAAWRFGDHDYSKPPHNTPDTALDCERHAEFSSGAVRTCNFQLADVDRFGPCEHRQEFEVVMYQPGSHDWIRGRACNPCAMTIRARAIHNHWAHAGNGLHSVQRLVPVADSLEAS